MAKFHFVEDYERHVRALKAAYPLDEAMSLAVGGGFDHIGSILYRLLLNAGLRNGMKVLDFGCGSGRVARQLGRNLKISYCGIDVVQDLLDYAAANCPPHYEFILNHGLTLPRPDGWANMIFAFSVFTHLLHEESYIYLEEMRRVIHPDGIVVFSFLEFHIPSHWTVFEMTVKQQKESHLPHLNMFIERNQITAWAQHLAFRVEAFIDGDKPAAGIEPLGQSLAILRPV